MKNGEKPVAEERVVEASLEAEYDGNQLEELAALYEASLAISHTLDLDVLLPKVLETITGLELFKVLNQAGILLVGWLFNAVL